MAVDGIEESLNLGISGLLFGRGLIGAPRHVTTLLDPGAQDTDLFGRERAGGWHLQAHIGTGQAQNQLTLGTFARHDDSAVIAAAEGILAEIEAETRLLLGRPVTAKALGREDGLDVLVVVNREVSDGWEFGRVLGL